LSNADISKWVDTSDEWILQRVGISSRCIADESETSVFMATQAAVQALSKAGVSPEEIELIIVATSTADHAMPSTAVEVQAQLGNTAATCFDLNAACSGFIYGLLIIQQFFATGRIKKALLIGAERMSRVVDWSDRSTCVLFGDGAGACVFQSNNLLEENNNKSNLERGILSVKTYSDGREKDLLYVRPHFSSSANFTSNGFNKDVKEANLLPYLFMEGNKVFKTAVNKLEAAALDILNENNISSDQVDWLVPHQANLRIILATAKKLNLPEEKIILTLAEQGNTSAASVPMALDSGVRSGKILKNNLLLLEAFGAGFVWGSALIRF